MMTENENQPERANNPTGKPMLTEHEPGKPGEKPIANYKILGGNLLLFALYTLTALSTGRDGGVASLAMAGIQFVICSSVAIASKRSVWFLSGVLVLIIGFGTCVSTFTLDTR